MNTPLTVDALSALLAELVRTRFWGSVQADFQNGQVILVRKTETIKSLESLKGNTHDHYNK